MAGYEKVKEWRSRPESKEKIAAQARRWREKHPDTAAEIKKRYRESHLEERRKTDKQAAASWRKNNPEAQKLREDRWKQKRELKLAGIAGRPRAESCDICKFACRTVFDHCHSSGNFRGWICDRCNKVLGLVYDSPDLLLALSEYLRNFKYGKVTCSPEEQSPKIGICAA